MGFWGGGEGGVFFLENDQEPFLWKKIHLYTILNNFPGIFPPFELLFIQHMYTDNTRHIPSMCLGIDKKVAGLGRAT